MSREEECSPEDIGVARQLLSQVQPGKASVILLSTVSAEGRPHSTWMFASRSTDPGIEILTITSPESLKVSNVVECPQVEWLICSQDRLQQLYLDGEAEVIEDVAEIKRLWAMVGGKDRAFFMKYYNSGIGFAIIRTRVTGATLAIPETYRKTRLELTDLV